MKALLVYPTHANCHEVADDLHADRIDAVCYPARRTSPSNDQPENCWNKDADKAEKFGLPVLKSVCLACPYRDRCQTTGYLEQLREATEADVALATHKRAAASGLAELARDSRYVAIHENAIELLRPSCRVTEPAVLLLHRVVNGLVTDPAWLDWFGNDLSRDENGNDVHDAEQKVQRERLFAAAVALVERLEALLSAIQLAESTTAWELPEPVVIPQRFERLLFRALCQAKVRLDAEAGQFALAMLAGELSSAVVIVIERHSDHSQGPPRRKSKVVLGVRTNALPARRTIWFCDSTANAERLARAAGQPVVDRTPDGSVPLQKKALQYVRDLTGKASRDVVNCLLRGTLARYGDRHRVGLITHDSLLDAVQDLEPEFRNRIVESTYFHSGQERSSNSWHQRCDLLLILGTPRVPPQAIAEYLVQVGELAAACNPPPWDTLYWQGETEAGVPVRVEGRGYQDTAWRSAHRDLVRSNLVQAVGRGRGVLETGCDVLVFSNEECGLQLAADQIPWLNKTAGAVWRAVSDLTAEKPKRYLLDDSAVSTSQLSSRLNLAQRTVREALVELESAGMVERLGSRSGWRLRARDDVHCSSAASCPAAANAADPLKGVSL